MNTCLKSKAPVQTLNLFIKIQKFLIMTMEKMHKTVNYGSEVE